MNKKSIIYAMSVGAVSALMLTACNNSNPNMDEEPAKGQPTATTGMKIAYVEVDSLMTQYNFCKDFSAVLQKKSNNARNTLTQKGQQLQAAVNNFQQKLNSNGFTSREQAESTQAAIQRQQENLQELQNRLASELDTETAKYNAALRDSLQNFLKSYNKTKKYDLILSKAGDNILLANPRYDITNDVINGLNKRYKPAKKAEEAKDKK